jgi:hypothetical protein
MSNPEVKAVVPNRVVRISQAITAGTRQTPKGGGVIASRAHSVAKSYS